jgi:hypothetical protein
MLGLVHGRGHLLLSTANLNLIQRSVHVTGLQHIETSILEAA